MNLFENLQMMKENDMSNNKQDFWNLINLITDTVHDKFNCDIDDVSWSDETKYPNEFIIQFVTYNILRKDINNIEDTIKDVLSNEFENVEIDYWKDNQYIMSPFIKSAWIFKAICDNNTLYEDFEVSDTEQEYTSAKTSINSSKLPAIFKMINLKPGTINIDVGGGKFDNVAEYYSDKDVTNLVWDPYNRSAEHNKKVLDEIRKNGGADSCTLSNVLNVIKEPEARKTCLQNCYNLLKSGGDMYITVYEGNGSGQDKATSSGYQLNKKTNEYLAEIQEIFPNAKRKGKLIYATK